MRALYRIPAGRPAPSNKGNAGLWYDKYCDQWPENRTWSLKSYKQESTEINPKERWIEKVTGTVGDENELREACKRRLLLAGGEDAKPQFFKTEWRFITGLGREHPVENGFAWHHNLGVPYLPGSSVKGLVRAWAGQWVEWDDSSKRRKTIDRIFGPDGAGQVGNLIFFDALPIGKVLLEADVMTPHYGPYYSDGEAPGDWHDPVPIPFLTVAPDQELLFLIVPCHSLDQAAAADAEQARTWLKDALEWIGAGAKTAVGYGRMSSRDEDDAEKRKKRCLAKQVDCRWVDAQIAEIAHNCHSPTDQVLRGRLLAQRWSDPNSPEKEIALECIKTRWDEQGWWENPPGRAAKQAKAIYLSGG